MMLMTLLVSLVVVLVVVVNVLVIVVSIVLVVHVTIVTLGQIALTRRVISAAMLLMRWLLMMMMMMLILVLEHEEARLELGIELARAVYALLEDRPGRQLAHRRRYAADAHGNDVLGRLLPLERHLGGHDPLPLGDQVALGAQAVLVLAVALVALEPRDHAVVAATRTFRLAHAALRKRQQRGRHWRRG